MDIFQEVKGTISMQEVVAGYGIKPNRGGMIRCPFHNDRTPSLKVYEDHFHCFGCGAHGDVIRFTEMYFNLSPLEAAKNLIDDYHLPVTEDISRSGNSRDRPAPEIRKRLEAHQKEKRFEKWREEQTKRFLDEYCKLSGWKERYAPRAPDEEWHPLFCEALQHLSKVEWELDLFLLSSKEELKELFLQENGKEQENERTDNETHEHDATCRWAG
ncbi:MAG: DNA primase [Lachnospiraceae bacterium]|nr:DNA primase [Lachnospiraceae bacterium]